MNDSASDTIKVDTARLPLLLRELRLPTIAAMWQSFTERADREGWPAARLLATLTELELAERDQRRIQRHLLEARLAAAGDPVGSRPDLRCRHRRLRLEAGSTLRHRRL
jgi:IstB-like ATP binding protein